MKIIFLHGELEEKIYMKQPEGFVQEGQKTRRVFSISPFMG